MFAAFGPVCWLDGLDNWNSVIRIHPVFLGNQGAEEEGSDVSPAGARLEASTLHLSCLGQKRVANTQGAYDIAKEKFDTPKHRLPPLKALASRRSAVASTSLPVAAMLQTTCSRRNVFMAQPVCLGFRPPPLPAPRPSGGFSGTYTYVQAHLGALPHSRHTPLLLLLLPQAPCILPAQ